VKPYKSIEDGDDDKSHIDAEAQEVIKYIYATEGHQYLVGMS
jgi:hypothetical protein